MITPEPDPLPPIFTEVRLPIIVFLLALALAVRGFLS